MPSVLPAGGKWPKQASFACLGMLQEAIAMEDCGVLIEFSSRCLVAESKHHASPNPT